MLLQHRRLVFKPSLGKTLGNMNLHNLSVEACMWKFWYESLIKAKVI
jgi:hypothetical protein